MSIFRYLKLANELPQPAGVPVFPPQLSLWLIVPWSQHFQKTRRYSYRNMYDVVYGTSSAVRKYSTPLCIDIREQHFPLEFDKIWCFAKICPHKIISLYGRLTLSILPKPASVQVSQM